MSAISRSSSRSQRSSPGSPFWACFGRLVGRGLEVGVAEPAPPAAGDHRGLADRDEVGEQLAGLVVVDGRAGRDVEDRGRRRPCRGGARACRGRPASPGSGACDWKSRSVVWPASTRRWTEPPRPPSPPSGPPRGTCASWRKVAAPSPPSPARTQIFTRSRNIGAILARLPAIRVPIGALGQRSDEVRLQVAERVDAASRRPRSGHARPRSGGAGRSRCRTGRRGRPAGPGRRAGRARPRSPDMWL